MTPPRSLSIGVADGSLIGQHFGGLFRWRRAGKWDWLLVGKSFSQLTGGGGGGPHCRAGGDGTSLPPCPILSEHSWGGGVSQLPRTLCNHQLIPRRQWGQGKSKTLLTCVPSRPTLRTLTVRLGKDTAHTNTRSGNQKYTIKFKLVLRLFSSFFRQELKKKKFS